MAGARTPVYFVSHGGPNVMFETEHPVYPKLQAMGREITQVVKPKAVVVFSAHWQAGRRRVEVNTAPLTELIYDYYGFPSHYYKVQYPNAGSPELAGRVLELLKGKGVDAIGVKRGLDHGVFAPFTCMFRPDENPLGVPIVQVSLYDSEDADAHYDLGAALQPLRDEGIVVIGSGMAVHNLRDMRLSIATGKPMAYAKPFDAALKTAVVDAPTAADRKTRLRELLKDPNARKAHPTFEHLLPIHIAAGAAGEDKAVRTYTLAEMSFSWAQYRFGEVPAAS
ncbi:Extradiol ring-cleavage dioxygenase, class III enzyme, subunit B [Geopyxis carbonaria]|nr:Extradiol ring-cleavage dioxygenase, class III enzyme, subunit B [Geopyxis carbonaria]